MAGFKRYTHVFFLANLCLASTSGSFIARKNSSFGHTYKTLPSRSAIECCSLCKLDDVCASVNFIPIDKACELNRKYPADFADTNITSTTHKDLYYTTSALCPESWVLFDRHCYHAQTTQRNWQDSEDYCKEVGATLTDVTSYYQNTFITDTFALNGFWIGLGTLHTATPLWTNGNPVDYTNFGIGEPTSNDGIENCVIMEPVGTWNDVFCDTGYPGVCKKQHY